MRAIDISDHSLAHGRSHAGRLTKSDSHMGVLRKFGLGIAAGSLIALVPTGAALADPNLTDVPRHQHYIETPDGDWVPVGPDICDNPDLQNAFNQFHNNVHQSGAQHKGPEGGAPGLDDGEGGDLVAVGCPISD